MDNVRDEIARSVDLDEINIMGCYRRGRSSLIEDNPATGRVLVNSPKHREMERNPEVIVDILDSFQLPMVAVEVRKGAVHRSGPNKVDLEREVVQGQAQFGVSMGIPGIENVSSTFGGFIELKSSITGQ